MKSEFYTAAKTFRRLLDYLDQIGLDSHSIAAEAKLSAARLREIDPEQSLPMIQYSALYTVAAQAMQELDLALPWAAGIGTEAFRFLCYSIIHCPTLGEALVRAERLQKLLYPLSRHRIVLANEAGLACVAYEVDASSSAAVFAPVDWERTANYEALARFSGLKIWYTFIGWLVGQNPELSHVEIAAAPLSANHQNSLEDIFQCPLHFNAARSALYFDTGFLSQRLIHSEESLEAFLENVIYNLGDSEAIPCSTSSAVKSLLARQDPSQLLPFVDMAETLHMSGSSLRRRLQAEGSSYQQIKDQYRRDLAIRMLRDGDLKVQEIGDKLGFLEPRSFIRSFKKWTGSTPKVFQDELSTTR